MPTREVIEEEQRLCSTREDVIHVHSHQVDTDGVMLTYNGGFGLRVFDGDVGTLLLYYT